MAASCTDGLPRTLWWETCEDGSAVAHLIDQTRLPVRSDVLSCRTYREMIAAIKSLALRGAPAIGVGGAFAMALWAVNESADVDVPGFMDSMRPVAEEVANARPTAVNLSWGVRMVSEAAQAAADAGSDCAGVKQAIVDCALKLYDEDVETNRLIGENGSALFSPGTRLMTHCNAGSLATVFYGTALGVMYSAYDKGLLEHVFACETRPVNQGGRLTSWELMQAGVPVTLICDNMAATVMSRGMVDAVVVGADRIAANGDTANKIGTMGHAVLAKHFGVPFYIAAPFSTIDASIPDGSHIDIEQRDPREIRGFAGTGAFSAPDDASMRALDMLVEGGSCELAMDGGHQMSIYRRGGDGDGVAAGMKAAGAADASMSDSGAAGSKYGFDLWIRNTPEDVDVFNPAFDVTPASLISGIITEKGVYKPDSSGRFHF